ERAPRDTDAGRRGGAYRSGDHAGVRDRGARRAPAPVPRQVRPVPRPSPGPRREPALAPRSGRGGSDRVDRRDGASARRAAPDRHQVVNRSPGRARGRRDAERAAFAFFVVCVLTASSLAAVYALGGQRVAWGALL